MVRFKSESDEFDGIQRHLYVLPYLGDLLYIVNPGSTVLGLVRWMAYIH